MTLNQAIFGMITENLALGKRILSCSRNVLLYLN